MKAFACVPVLLASCGTMMNGGPFLVPVDSRPQGASVRYAGAIVGKTPCQVGMFARDQRIELSMDGFAIRHVEVPVALNWISPVGNGCLLLIGLVGMAVDMSTKCNRRIVTDPILVDLASGHLVQIEAAPKAAQSDPGIGAPDY